MESDIWTTEYVKSFVTVAEEESLLAYVAEATFPIQRARGRDLRRRNLQFGAYYLVSGRMEPAPAIPPTLEWLKEKVQDHCQAEFDQLIITWYPPGAGIGVHRDSPKFGDPVAGLSIGSSCTFRGRTSQGARRSQVLLPRSLYVLRGQERWEWKHDIASHKDDRWSFTFRILS